MIGEEPYKKDACAWPSVGAATRRPPSILPDTESAKRDRSTVTPPTMPASSSAAIAGLHPEDPRQDRLGMLAEQRPGSARVGGRFGEQEGRTVHADGAALRRRHVDEVAPRGELRVVDVELLGVHDDAGRHAGALPRPVRRRCQSAARTATAPRLPPARSE